jgi:hypothetical protein
VVVSSCGPVVSQIPNKSEKSRLIVPNPARELKPPPAGSDQVRPSQTPGNTTINPAILRASVALWFCLPAAFSRWCRSSAFAVKNPGKFVSIRAIRVCCCQAEVRPKPRFGARPRSGAKPEIRRDEKPAKSQKSSLLKATKGY